MNNVLTFNLFQALMKSHSLHFYTMLSHKSHIYACYLVAFMDLFAVGMIIPYFNRRCKDLGASPSFIGLIGSIYGCLQFFSSPYMGKASDKFGRKPIILLSFSGCIIGYFTLGLADTIFLFALTRIPTGILKHSMTATRAYLTDITLPEERAGVLGTYNAVGSMGFIIAPIIGGHVAMKSNGFFKVSLLTCSTYLAAFLFVHFVFESKQEKNKDGIEHEKEPTTFLSSITSVMKIKSVGNVIDLILVRFIMGLSMMIYHNNFTAMLDSRYGVDTKTIGYIISFGSIARAISGISIGRVYVFCKNDHTKAMVLGGLLLATSLFGLTFAINIHMMLICILPLSLSTSLLRVSCHSLVFKRSHADERGAVMGFGDSITSIARMLAPVIAGFAQEISVIGPCFLATCCSAIGVTIILFYPKNKALSENEPKKIN